MGMIAPSIFTLMGEFEVKNRSDALRSTMSLNSGRVLRTIGAESPARLASTVSSSCSFTAGISALLFVLAAALPAGLERAALLIFVDDGERATVVQVLDLALALELDLEAQLVLRIGVAQRVF